MHEKNLEKLAYLYEKKLDKLFSGDYNFEYIF